MLGRDDYLGRGARSVCAGPLSDSIHPPVSSAGPDVIRLPFVQNIKAAINEKGSQFIAGDVGETASVDHARFGALFHREIPHPARFQRSGKTIEDARQLVPLHMKQACAAPDSIETGAPVDLIELEPENLKPGVIAREIGHADRPIECCHVVAGIPECLRITT